MGLMFYLAMFWSVFSSIRRFPRFERRFALVLFATLITAMLPLTWEDNKVAWFVMAVLIGMSPFHFIRPREEARSSFSPARPRYGRPVRPVSRPRPRRRERQPSTAPERGR